MNKAFFRRQFEHMQSRFNQAKQRGVFARIFAWLMLGVLLVVGLALFVFFLLLSWLLIPIHLWRQRKQFQQRPPNNGQTIEGDVVDKRED